MRQLGLKMRQVYLELSKDDHMKGYAKAIKSLQKIIENHPYTNSMKFL